MPVDEAGIKCQRDISIRRGWGHALDCECLRLKVIPLSWSNNDLFTNSPINSVKDLDTGVSNISSIYQEWPGELPLNTMNIKCAIVAPDKLVTEIG